MSTYPLITIAATSDLLLLTADASKTRSLMQVSRAAMSAASKVWKERIDKSIEAGDAVCAEDNSNGQKDDTNIIEAGGAVCAVGNSNGHNDENNNAQSPIGHSSDSGLQCGDDACIYLDFTEDNQEALITLMNLAHKTDKHHAPTLPDLVEIAELCDKYKLKDLIGPYSFAWLHLPSKHTKFDPAWLCVAHSFGNTMTVQFRAREIIVNLEMVDGDLYLPGEYLRTMAQVPETIKAVMRFARNCALGRLLKKAYQHLNACASSPTRNCKEPTRCGESHQCAHAIFTSLGQQLRDMGLYPRVEAGQVTKSLVALAADIEGLRAIPYPGHARCGEADYDCRAILVWAKKQKQMAWV